MRRNIRNRNKRNETIDYKKVIQTLGLLILTLTIFLIVISIFYHFKNNYEYQKLIETSKQEIENQIKPEESSKEAKKEETDTTFTMTAIGDIMCHNTQYWDAYDKNTNTYDFSYVFEDISYYTKVADICVGSLETSFAGEERGYRSYPTFNSPDSLAYNLKDIGLDVISTAGNHCLDMGFSGLSRTIDVLNDSDISHLGTYKSQEEQDKILFKYVKGIKIAFINYTYGTNGIPVPSDKQFCVNLIDKDLIQKQIQAAKEGNADVIVACMHWGTEYRTTANEEQKELADFLFKNGVDVILGNHPHVLEPMEKRTVTLEDGTQKEGFVIYALGNFMADQNAEHTRNSIILNLTITKHTDGKLAIDKVNYVPIYMYKNTSSQGKKMKLLDIRKTISNYEQGVDTSIDNKTYQLLQKELNKITNIVGDEITN